MESKLHDKQPSATSTNSGVIERKLDASQDGFGVGRRAQSNARELVFLFASVFLLAGWLASALWLSITRLFLPDNALHIDTNNYNTFVSFAGQLIGTIVSFGIGAGFRAVLKQRIKRRQGVSVVWYDALVHFSWMSLQAKLRWTAILSVPLFLLNQTFSAASQAAFGASEATASFSAPWVYAHVAENLPVLQASNFSLFTYPYDSGDLLNMGHLRFADFDNERPLVMLDGNRMYAGQDDPLVSPSPFEIVRYYLNETIPGSNFSGIAEGDLSGAFDTDEKNLYNAGNKAYQQAVVEGFLSRVQCSDYASTGVNTSFQPVPDAQVFVGSFAFDCGQKLVVYSNDTSIADIYACEDGSPDLYFMFISDTSALTNSSESQNVLIDGDPNLTFTKCTVVSITSGSYTVSKYERGGTSLMEVKSKPSPNSLTVIPTSFPIVKFMGDDLLNNFGRQGWSGLAQSLVWTFTLSEISQSDATRINQFLERLVERLVKATLAQIAAAVAVEADSLAGDPDGLNYTESSSEFTFYTTALQLHLEGNQFVWLIVPVALLSLQLLLSYHIFSERHDSVNLTNPITTAYIGIVSENHGIDPDRDRQWLSYEGSRGRFVAADNSRPPVSV
ncbi:hypothetical protein OIV83_003714 [Microbotryomycetes sp. JL201]|nr:hypothetical protein OIV83_003714 [Microbotryomycetes sp. JL201]